MTVISPTVGRIVWYRKHSQFSEWEQPEAAIVVKAITDRLVNLTVFDHNGYSRPMSAVQLWQDGDEPATGSYCEWMPYQKGQAAKAEEVVKGRGK